MPASCCVLLACSCLILSLLDQRATAVDTPNLIDDLAHAVDGDHATTKILVHSGALAGQLSLLSPNANMEKLAVTDKDVQFFGITVDDGERDSFLNVTLSIRFSEQYHRCDVHRASTRYTYIMSSKHTLTRFMRHCNATTCCSWYPPAVTLTFVRSERYKSASEAGELVLHTAFEVEVDALPIIHFVVVCSEGMSTLVSSIKEGKISCAIRLFSRPSAWSFTFSSRMYRNPHAPKYS